MDTRNIPHVSEYYQEGYCPHDKVLHVRTTIPGDWGNQLSHIVVDLGISKGEALRQAVAMFLRCHGRAGGTPEPQLSMSAEKEVSR